MRAKPSPRCVKGFTLIELLVGIAVLAVMLVLLAQMVSLASRIWSAGNARVDNFSQARTVLGVIDRDIRSMVLRRDLASFVDAGGNPACAFYTRIPAPGQDRKLSLVSYETSTQPGDPGLLRRDLGFSYDSASSPRYGTLGTLADLNSATSQMLTDGAIRFETQFLRADGTLGSVFQYDFDDPAVSSNTRSVVLSVLVVDSHALKLAKDTGKLSALLEAFSGTPGTGQSYAGFWNSRILDGTALASFPEPIRLGVKAFERQVALPVSLVR